MSQARTLQFTDLDTLCEAYRNSGIEAFALWEHTNPYHTYEGDDIEEGEAQIRDMVGKLVKAQSAAIYTIKLYKGLKKDEFITNKTQWVRSWNFRLFDHRGSEYSGLPAPNRGGDERYINKLESENAAYKLRIAELEEELDQVAEPEEPPEDAIGKVTRLLENPMIQNSIRGITSFVQGLMRKGSPPAEGQSMNGIGGFAGDWRTDEMIANAMRLLSERDPDLAAVLNQWAALCVHKPSDYAMYKGMLLNQKF